MTSPVRPASSSHDLPVGGDDEGFESIGEAPTPAVTGEAMDSTHGAMIDADSDDVTQPAVCFLVPELLLHRRSPFTISPTCPIGVGAATV